MNKPRTKLANGGVIAKLAFVLTNLSKVVTAMPIFQREDAEKVVAAHPPMTAEQFYANLALSVFLVLAGGVFAGLTLGLMGQDEVYLKVIASSGEPLERKYAKKVLRLIGRGKHWVLVTLLLCNVITNETLPIVLDRCLGGGWPAIVAATALIVVFGEIIPQSICVRYGLQVGAIFAPFVLMLMYIMYPIAYPCALLLDHILGEDHGTVYKKSGLKTLVTLHRTMGVERLNQDEVTIISAVLDLKEKSVSDIMTPMKRVYTMSADTVLDEEAVEEIFNAGFSRIPIHLPNEPNNFIGMLLVRVLISYDPEDALPVSNFPLATLPETSLETSCLNILNYFQEGKSHMIVVSNTPGEPTGAVGVLTLEDVIEELIGEEIVDESDVFVDVNKNIKRAQPGPLSKRNLTVYLHNLYQLSNHSKRNSLDGKDFDIRRDLAQPKEVESEATKFLTPKVTSRLPPRSPVLGAVNESAIDGAKNWIPKNLALNPLETSKPFVTIKRPNPDAVRNPAVVPGPSTKGANINVIHASEEGALREAQRRVSLDEDGPVRNGNGNGHVHQNAFYPDAAQNVANHQPVDIPDAVLEFQETRSYRTGGIIESVIEVQGVHKTIIENVTDDEERHNDITVLDDESIKRKKKKKSKKRSDLFTLSKLDVAVANAEASDEEGELLRSGSSNDSGKSLKSGGSGIWTKITGN